MANAACDNKTPQDLWKGVVAGMIAGFVASWAMNHVSTIWSKINERGDQPEQTAKKGEQSDPATLKLAKRLSRELLHRELSEDQAEIAEAAVHYSFGTIMGAVYGGLAEYIPETTAGFGSAYGTILFVGADEIAVPLAALSGKANEVPLSSHVLGFTHHMVYGVTAEMVRRRTRKLFAA